MVFISYDYSFQAQPCLFRLDNNHHRWALYQLVLSNKGLLTLYINSANYKITLEKSAFDLSQVLKKYAHQIELFRAEFAIHDQDINYLLELAKHADCCCDAYLQLAKVNKGYNT